MKGIINKIRGTRNLKSGKSDADYQTFKINDGEEKEFTIEELCVLSRKGLWGLFVFLAVSALAYIFQELTLTGVLTPAVRELLGPKPPVILINVVLVVSTLSSIIIIAGRLYNSLMPGRTWTHLMFRLFFFFLYFISDSLQAHFNMVFISGLVVLALQNYHVLSYTTRLFEQQLDVFNRLSLRSRLAGK